jgi:23S rRNA (guanosine2251-2'-O)-methyltransferase
MENKQNKEKDELIYGIHSIIETIKSGKTLSKVFIDRSSIKTASKELLDLLHKQNIPFSNVPKIKLDKLTKKNHQGAIGLMSPIEFSNLEDIIQATFESGKMPFILLLNQVTDVRNVGAIVRTAACVGVDAVVVEWSGSAMNGDCMKVSAGALSKVPICRTKNIFTTISYLQGCGIIVAACTEKAEKTIYTADFKQPIALLMGSEGFGISSSNLKKTDFKIKIPMHGSISSLNVSVAAAIAMYEVLRQRTLQ